MNPDYKSNGFNKDQYVTSILEGLTDKEALKTKRILMQEHTEYTNGANEIIKKVQAALLENKRYAEIDKALDEKDKSRFIALTSEGWEQAL
ncbi:IDEAL domain-containing protein [Peribacillus sp. SCS-155]|uniref:IDEAL domain-containing protein n=1 Tax=Peribacillus sedimenti TaxID=3115297 RepID=UPI0039066BA6